MKAAVAGLLARLRRAAVGGIVPEQVFLEQARALGLGDVERERLRGELAGLGLPVGESGMRGGVCAGARRGLHADGDGPYVEMVAPTREENVPTEVSGPGFRSGDVARALLSRYADPDGYVTRRALDGVIRLAGLGAREAAVLRAGVRVRGGEAAAETGRATGDGRPGGPPRGRSVHPADAEQYEPEDGPDEDEPLPPAQTATGRGPGDLAAAVAAAKAVLENDRFRRRPETRLLSAEAEVGLAVLLRGGPDHVAEEPDDLGGLPPDDLRVRARDCLVLHNQRLVRTMVPRYLQQGLDYEDLFQHGVLGLMRAARKFDPARGFKFSTYATWWIRQSMTRSIADEGAVIRVPVHMHEQMRKVARAESTLATRGRPASVADVAVYCDTTTQKVEEVRKLSRRTDSLDRVVGDGVTLGDFIGWSNPLPPVEKGVLDAMLLEQVMEVLGTLPAREAHILSRRLGLDGGEPSTLEELGQQIGRTRERVRQIESKAKKKFRSRLVEAGLTAACLYGGDLGEVPGESAEAGKPGETGAAREPRRSGRAGERVGGRRSGSGTKRPGSAGAGSCSAVARPGGASAGCSGGVRQPGVGTRGVAGGPETRSWEQHVPDTLPARPARQTRPDVGPSAVSDEASTDSPSATPPETLPPRAAQPVLHRGQTDRRYDGHAGDTPVTTGQGRGAVVDTQSADADSGPARERRAERAPEPEAAVEGSRSPRADTAESGPPAPGAAAPRPTQYTADWHRAVRLTADPGGGVAWLAAYALLAVGHAQLTVLLGPSPADAVVRAVRDREMLDRPVVTALEVLRRVFDAVKEAGLRPEDFFERPAEALVGVTPRAYLAAKPLVLGESRLALRDSLREFVAEVSPRAGEQRARADSAPDGRDQARPPVETPPPAHLPESAPPAGTADPGTGRTEAEPDAEPRRPGVHAACEAGATRVQDVRDEARGRPAEESRAADARHLAARADTEQQLDALEEALLRRVDRALLRQERHLRAQAEEQIARIVDGHHQTQRTLAERAGHAERRERAARTALAASAERGARAEQRATEAEQRTEYAEQRAHAAEHRANRAEQRANEAERRASTAEERATALLARANEAQRRAEETGQRLRRHRDEGQTRIADLEQRLRRTEVLLAERDGALRAARQQTSAQASAQVAAAEQRAAARVAQTEQDARARIAELQQQLAAEREAAADRPTLRDRWRRS